MFIVTLVGAALLVVVLVEIVTTTLTMRGAGPLTSRIMHGMWRGLLSTAPRGAHRRLAAGGIAIVIASILAWVILLWIGWSLVFLGSSGAVVATDSGLPAGFWDRVYFAGFTLFTLGLGDFRPQGSGWQILTAACAANRLLALTMAVTYLMPVLSAAAARRQLAAGIHCLGSTPDGILELCWNGSHFQGIEEALNDLLPDILLVSQQHLAYPALNYFHSEEGKTSLPLRIAALDETLSILAQAVPREASPDRVTVTRARAAIGILLEAMNAAHIKPSEEPPPSPPIERLRRLDMFEVDVDALASGLAACRQRRCLLLGWISSDGRQWEEVWQSE